MALELGRENIRAVKRGPALQLSLRDKPGLMEAVFSTGFFLALNQGMWKRPCGLLLAPCGSYKKLFWEPALSGSV